MTEEQEEKPRPFMVTGLTENAETVLAYDVIGWELFGENMYAFRSVDETITFVYLPNFLRVLMEPLAEVSEAEVPSE